MSFTSINIQGNIISSEILDKIRSEEKFKHQTPEAFGLSRTASLRDEIGHAWSIMRTHWQAYKKRLESLPTNDTGTSLTRERLIIPLLAELGYETSRQNAQQINGKSYAISHGAANRDMFPIHIMGFKDDLDKRRESGGPRLSPHALVQEYLNNTEYLFALVTNGRKLRLLRDATRLVRMSYLEFNLEQMFEEELYADFSILYRVLHASRMPEKMDEGPDSVIEFYHHESMASGTRIREKLSEAVEDSIKTLANGFLSHSKNRDLVELFNQNSLSAEDYYTYQLRLIYRILFLIVLEERKIIYPENITEEQQRFRKIYYRYYSIERLRKLTENQIYIDADKHDLWESLKTTFLLFEDEEFGSKLGIKPLGSGLFASNALGSLKDQFLKNGDLIEVLKRLTTFINEQGQLVRVNYSDLDVEEFGSVYEGLLEYDPVVEKIGIHYQFSFVAGDDRSSSGSHYTPEELVKPLIKHSLDYIIADKLKESNPEEALLSITVCDVACGSGHILLSAARKIATELASIREGAEQPSPTFYRAAIRDVIRNCIYGVDLNPLAVELCKVALWLEAHNPNEPLNFLDHHIKNGNAIVGLAHFEELQNGIASEAFKALPGDDKSLASELKKKNTLEKKSAGQLSTYDISQVDDSLRGLQNEFANFTSMPEDTPEQIDIKAKVYKDLTQGKKWYRLKTLADLQVAQFFIPKTLDNKEKLTTEAKYRTYLNTGTQILDRGASMAMAAEKRFFHWFLEFPEVFNKGGFDCILGNPPFLGGQYISGDFGIDFAEYLKVNYAPIKSVDLVTYFFRRIFNLLSNNRFMSLISTKTIAEGAAREGGLAVILNHGGVINHAVKNMPWPGVANVEVALITIIKGEWNNRFILNGKSIRSINSYLDDQGFLGDPCRLNVHENKSYQGSIILGEGFILDKEKASMLISENTLNQDVIFKYQNGNEINNNIYQEPGRYVINFQDWDERKSKKYKDCFSIVEEKVLIERIESNKEKIQKGGKLNNDDKWKIKEYWKYLRPRKDLYKQMDKLPQVLAISTGGTKYVTFAVKSEQTIYANTVAIILLPSFSDFSLLNNSLYDQWAWKYCTVKGGSTLRFAPTSGFETFPFPKNNELNNLDKIGDFYNEFRKNLMHKIQLGLTKTYNQMHNLKLNLTVEELTHKNFEKKFGKETWNLYKHLEVKKEGKISYQEAVPLIFKLRELHKEMDEAVMAAYGWNEDSEKWGKAIKLRHDFYEVDYLPENDRVRYTIHPDARKEVLKRLLLLNHERFEEEVKQGLHKRKDVVSYFEQKGKPIPEGTVFSDGKAKKSTPKKTKSKKIEPPKEQYGLFDKPSKQIIEGSKVDIRKDDGTVFKYHITKSAVKGSFTGAHKQIATSSKLSELMLGKKTGDAFDFGPNTYSIIGVE